MRNERDLRITAIHEAGHALAHFRLDIKAGKVSIVPDTGKNTNGSTQGSDRMNDDGSNAKDHLLAYLSGYAALIASGQDETTASLGCEDDFESAELIIANCELPGDMQTWKTEAINFMQAPRNFAATAKIATHLLQRLVLDSDYVAALVEWSDGDATEADFARYLVNSEDLRPKTC